MEDYKERPIVEQKELKDKLAKLVEFINSEKFYELSPNNRLLLKNQKAVMELYLNILNTRLYEDVDNASITDLGMLGLFTSVMSGGSLFPSSNSVKALSDTLKKDDEKRQIKI